VEVYGYSESKWALQPADLDAESLQQCYWKKGLARRRREVWSRELSYPECVSMGWKHKILADLDITNVNELNEGEVKAVSCPVSVSLEQQLQSKIMDLKLRYQRLKRISGVGRPRATPTLWPPGPRKLDGG
jgi:hypothetical protein